MILYTPLSESDIFPVDPKSFEAQQTLTVDGRMIRVSQMDDGSYQVVQLLSTDPQDYLDSRYSPGSKINQSDIQM